MGIYRQDLVVPASTVVGLVGDKVHAALASGIRRAQLVAVFDIDHFALHNGPRNAAIIARYAGHPQHRPLPIDFGRNVARLARERARAGTNHYHAAEEWAELTGEAGRDCARHFSRYWFRNFFSSDWLRHDVPMSHFRRFWVAVERLGVRVIFLTGRHMACRNRMPQVARGMAHGTYARFQDLGWGQPHIVFKPYAGGPPVYAFKRNWFDTECGRGKLVPVLFGDNEPQHVNNYLDSMDAHGLGALCVGVLHTRWHHPNDAVRLDARAWPIDSFRLS